MFGKRKNCSCQQSRKWYSAYGREVLFAQGEGNRLQIEGTLESHLAYFYILIFPLFIAYITPDQTRCMASLCF